MPATPVQPGGTGFQTNGTGYQNTGTGFQNGFQNTGTGFQNAGGTGFQNTGTGVQNGFQNTGTGFQNTGTGFQTAPAGATSGMDTAFSVALPAMQTYYLQHGGVRSLGQPLSHDFQLLGRRVQIFENEVLQQRSDGAIRAFDVLGDDLPLTHAAGATFPGDDPDMIAGIPALDTPDYQNQAMAAIDGGLLDWAAPDSWNDLPVNFGATFRATVSCSDLPPSQVCDDRQLLAAAVDVWGLPTSAPAFDPSNQDMVYLRFQRGIMQFSQSTGETKAVPIGSWFKRVLLGTDLPDDLLTDVVGSRYYAQYAPAQPQGIARAKDLPMSSLSAAFSAAANTASAGFGQSAAGGFAQSTDASATPVFAPALPNFGAVGTPTPVSPSATSFTGTPSATVTGTVTPVASGTPAASTSSSTSAGPEGPDPCAGDEQIYFAPKKNIYANSDVLIAVTSATHHDMRTVRLTGPIKTGQVNERPGLNGWVWEWTVTPAVEGWYEFTFYTDGARACATSGFNALPAFGATAVPSVTATPQPLLSLTATPTATPIAAPSLAATGIDPSSGCAGRLVRLTGENFGATSGSVLLVGGPASQSSPGNGPTIVSWTNTSILALVPANTTPGEYQIVVTTSSGSGTTTPLATTPLKYTISTCPS